MSKKPTDPEVVRDLLLPDEARVVYQKAPRRPQIHIVFDGPPGHESGRFVEVEDEHGQSICVGTWEQKGDFWHLVIDKDPTP